MTGHATTVQTLPGGPEQSTKHYASCSCGWCGQLRSDRDVASADAGGHQAYELTQAFRALARA